MQDLETLGRKLRSTDAEERRETAAALGSAGAGAVPLLFEALKDADWRVRKTAVEVLVARAGSEVHDGLIRTLHAHDNAGARNSAIEALVQIGAPMVTALLPVLRTTDPDVRKFAVDILGDIRDPRAVPELIERLTDADENIRVAAAEALGKIRDPRAVDALLGCLNRPNQGWLDYAAAEALGEIGDTRALEPLIAALGRSSLREPVLESLGKIGNAGTITPLVASLADPLRIVREVSVAAIAAIFRKSAFTERQLIIAQVRGGVSAEAAELLEEILLTSGGDLQKAAIALLGWTGRERAVNAVVAALRDEDLEETVAQSLRYIDRAAAMPLIGHLDNDNALVRRTIARVLGMAACAEAEDRLIGLLPDENGHVRSAAAEALGRIKSRKALPGLIGLLEDEYPDVQESAIRALSAIGDESALVELMRDFSSRDAYLRKNIVVLLGGFATERAADALAFAMKDEEADVRKAAVSALAGVSGDKALRALLLAASDDDPEVRMRAAEALGGRRGGEGRDALAALLADDDLWVRAAAARGLGKGGGEREAAVLASHLGAATDIFLLALVEQLGRLDYRPAAERLLGLITHADHEVRKTVIAALAGWEGDEVRRAVAARLSDEHWSVRKAAVEAVRKNRTPAVDRLLSAMAESDPDASVRQAANEALG